MSRRLLESGRRLETACVLPAGHMMGVTAVIRDRQTLFSTLLAGWPRDMNELLIGRRMKAVVGLDPYVQSGCAPVALGRGIAITDINTGGRHRLARSQTIVGFADPVARDNIRQSRNPFDHCRNIAIRSIRCDLNTKAVERRPAPPRLSAEERKQTRLVFHPQGLHADMNVDLAGELLRQAAGSRHASPMD